jgi:hypothetical protein
VPSLPAIVATAGGSIEIDWVQEQIPPGTAVSALIQRGGGLDGPWINFDLAPWDDGSYGVTLDGFTWRIIGVDVLGTPTTQPSNVLDFL